MFDIGFAELLLIGVVALLVIGPERLPGTIRTASLYLNRLRRSFNEIKQEIQQELHNDEVMRQLRETGKQLQDETRAIGRDLDDSVKPTPTSPPPAANSSPPPPDSEPRP